MTDPVFFVPARRYSAAEIASLTGAQLLDPATAAVEVSGIASATSGGEGMLIFVEGQKNANLLKGQRAAAVLCTEDAVKKVPKGIAILVTPRPQQAFALVGRLLHPAAAIPKSLTGQTGISPKAYLAPGAVVEDGATIEAGASIGPGGGGGQRHGRRAECRCRDGHPDRPRLLHRAQRLGAIRPDRQPGGDPWRRPGRPGRLRLRRRGQRAGAKIPQIGRVVIQDDVEIGANTTIDRGAMSDTVIGEGTKIDNLVQIAHNVRIGRGCIIAGHCGLSGSVTLGDFVMLGGRVGDRRPYSIGERSLRLPPSRPDARHPSRRALGGFAGAARSDSSARWRRQAGLSRPREEANRMAGQCRDQFWRRSTSAADEASPAPLSFPAG